MKSILRTSSYTQSINYDFAIFRTNEKSAFKAHQTGLRNHQDSCTKDLCDTCKFAREVSKYSWDLRNYSRYLRPFENKPKLSDKKEQKKKVSFGELEVFNKKQMGLQFNMVSFARACYFNVSMIETKLLNN